jgi:hypothetical protein
MQTFKKLPMRAPKRAATTTCPSPVILPPLMVAQKIVRATIVREGSRGNKTASTIYLTFLIYSIYLIM